MKVIIGGCGRVGAQLAGILSLEKHAVTVLDKNPAAFQRLSKVYGGTALEGGAFDEEMLLRAGIREADVYAVVTNYDNANLMAAEVADRLFRVPRIIARLYNPDKEATYQALGIDYVCGTKLVARAILEKIHRPLVRMRGQCANNTQYVVEFDWPGKWRKTAGYLREEMGMRIAWVRRGDRSLFPQADFVPEAGDVITALLSEGDLQRLERKLKKRERRWGRST